MTDFIYNESFFRWLRGEIDLLNDTLKVALLDNTYVPDRDNDSVFGDVSGSEIAAGLGYTAGGETLAGKSVTKDNLNDWAMFDCNDVSGWSAATFTGARYGVIYVASGVPATSYLIYLVDLDFLRNAPLELIWNASGIFAVGRCA